MYKGSNVRYCIRSTNKLIASVEVCKVLTFIFSVENFEMFVYVMEVMVYLCSFEQAGYQAGQESK